MKQPYAIVIPVGSCRIGLFFASGDPLPKDFGPWVPHVCWTGNRAHRTKFTTKARAEACLTAIKKLKTRHSKDARVVRLRNR